MKPGLPTPQLQIKGGRGVTCDVQVSTNLVTSSSVTSLTVTNATGTVVFTDAAGLNGGGRFCRAMGQSASG